MMLLRARAIAIIVAALVCHGAQEGYAQSANSDLAKAPWKNVHLSPDERADLVLKELYSRPSSKTIQEQERTR